MGTGEITGEADMFAFGTVVVEVGIHTWLWGGGIDISPNARSLV